MKEIAMAGPAPGRPKEVEWVIRYCKRGAFKIEETCSFCPAIAVPTTVKIPEPITAPMPSDVRLSHPSDFFNRISAFSESDSSWSMFLQRNRGDATQALRSYPRPRRQPCGTTAQPARGWTRYVEVLAPHSIATPHPAQLTDSRPIDFSCSCRRGVYPAPSLSPPICSGRLPRRAPFFSTFSPSPRP